MKRPVTIIPTANTTPERRWDWLAHFGDEDGDSLSVTATGETREKALQNFIDSLEEEVILEVVDN
jgi:predicted RNase H-like HicB family nuclease